jgi:hypothetical protein
MLLPVREIGGKVLSHFPPHVFARAGVEGGSLSHGPVLHEADWEQLAALGANLLLARVVDFGLHHYLSVLAGLSESTVRPSQASLPVT